VEEEHGAFIKINVSVVKEIAEDIDSMFYTINSAG